MKSIPQIFFTHSALENMFNLAQEDTPYETGGLVLGKSCTYEGGHALVVTQVSGPGPQAQLHTHGFRPDMAYYQQVMQKHDQLHYLGEWHKHPHSVPSWSAQDLTQALQILEQEQLIELICPICVRVRVKQGLARVQMQCYYLQAGMATFLPLSYRVVGRLEDHSTPLRYVAVAENVARNFIRSRKTYHPVPADLYPQYGVLHVFEHPYRANTQVLLVNARRCRELKLADEQEVVLVVRARPRRPPLVRAYALAGLNQQELTTDLISPQADVFQRNHALLETQCLRTKHVAIIGLGSIGATAALELTRAGVGRFTLIDPDTVSITNLCRHVCDLTELGVPKVKAVAARIKRILPQVEVHAYVADTNHDADATLQICRAADILLVATDTENSRLLANWIAHQLNIPLIVAGLFERALGGRVWRIQPGKGACYACYPATQQMLPPARVAYSESTAADLTIQPGLGNDIAFITHLAVRYVIESLTSGSQLPEPIVFWFNHPHEQWCPQALTLYKVAQLAPQAHCRICQGLTPASNTNALS